MEESVADVVFVRPGVFEQRHAPLAAEEVAALCRPLREARRPFLLIGYGRWGSSDPWLGIPVGWGDVAGARVIVEATLPGRPVEMSQGSHFFHNLAAFGVSYFSVPSADDGAIDWAWLERQEVGRGANGHAARAPRRAAPRGGRRSERPRSRLASSRRLSAPARTGV